MASTASLGMEGKQINKLKLLCSKIKCLAYWLYEDYLHVHVFTCTCSWKILFGTQSYNQEDEE